ncbi:MAG: DeoR/GlpR family DNA-binding transcription regulator [Candidatus Latescibacterota bacterium]|jgi:DeoR/GlpR family transcriptional regulator of sugar metabolism
MSKVLLPERWEKIIALIQNQGRVSVEVIAQALGISSPTVRRDLARIEERGLIRRTWGGAEPSRSVPPGITLAESRRVNPAEKSLIGEVAAGLVRPGECILLDGGFTTYELARQMEASGVTVVTNSLDVARLVAGRREAKLVVLGGELLAASGTLVGPATQRQLAGLLADRAFLGANAFSPETGLCADIELTAETKRAMVAAAREVVVVADHGKLGKSALYRVAPVEAIATLVTDDRVDQATLEAFRGAGVEVIVAAAADRNPAASAAAQGGPSEEEES